MGLKKWWTFCSNIKINQFNPTVPEVLKFLSEEYSKGAGYGTLNGYRSALALLAGPSLGQDDIVKRFFRGVRNVRPNKPRYDITWDPQIVLDFYRQLPHNVDLSLKDLSEKLIILLALVTGHRLQTFSLMEVDQIREMSDHIEVRIPRRIKTSKSSEHQPNLIIPFYNDDKTICVASTLKLYLEKTRLIRGDVKSLFISFRRPHKAVGAQTLSHWIKNILMKCKIDVSIFSGYSTRHAATSAAKRSGVDIDIIKKTAGWSQKSQTFAKFYNLPLVHEKDRFAKAILKRK